MSRLYLSSKNTDNPNFTLNALLSAILCALPFSFPVLLVTAWIGMLPFFASLACDSFLRAKKRRAFSVGFMWGFFYCVFIYYWFLWLYPLDFAGLTALQGGLVVGVAWLGISAFQALFFGAGTLIINIIGRKSPFITAVVFTLCEFMWHFGTFGLPWCKISLTQYKFLPAIQSSALFGSLFVSFIIYAVNAYIAYSAVNKKYLAVSAVLFLSNILYGAVIMNIPVNYTDKAEFALIQGNIASSDKWRPDSAYQSFDMFFSLSAEASEKENPDFTVWPESAVPVSINSSFKEGFLAVPHATDSILLTGAFGEEEGKSSNSLFMVDKNGINPIFYSKRHLVPFGEYLPMRSVLEIIAPFTADINMLSSDLYQGTDSRIMSTDYGKIGSLICFDSIFPALSRQSVLDGAQLLVLVTNDSWYFDSPATYQHCAQAVFRAVENRRSVARCANTGISALIDERGRIKDSLPALEKGYISGELNFTDTHTLYTYIGDALMYAAAVYIIILLIRRCSKWKSRPSV